MTTINRKVLDISHWNEVTSWEEVKRAGILGIVHKSTEGTSYIDPNYVKVKQQAQAEGLLWGAYHFATSSDPRAQVDHFLKVTGIHDDMLYALDWEDYGDNTMDLLQAREFLEIMGEHIGPFRCVIYSGNTAKEALGDSEDTYFGSHRLWLAQYSSSPVVQPSWSTWWLHQYGDGEVGPAPQGCPGCSGAVDTNSWAGSDEELAEQWDGINTPNGSWDHEPIRPPQSFRSAIVKLNIVAQGDVLVLLNGRVVPLGDEETRKARMRGGDTPRR